MRPEVQHAALVQHQDGVAVGQRRQPVRHDHHGAAARHVRQVGVDQGLAFRIERAGRLVQDQDARVVHQGAGDRQALPLAAGQVGRAFLDQRLIAVRQALDELRGAGQPGGMDRVRQRQAGAAGQDVFRDRAAEQEVLLQHHAEVAAQMRQVDVAQIDAVDADDGRCSRG